MTLLLKCLCGFLPRAPPSSRTYQIPLKGGRAGADPNATGADPNTAGFGNNGQGFGNNGQGGPASQGAPDPASGQQRFQAIQDEEQQGISRILAPKQLLRLKQIGLQREGPIAV